MTVVLTAPVEGLQPGANYTGANEAYHLASGNAKQASYTGPGVANTGNADTSIANNREFDATRGTRAKAGGTPEAGTNDNIVLVTATEPTFANSPTAQGAKLEVNSVLKANGTAATGLATAGGTVVKVKGFGFTHVNDVEVEGGTNVTDFDVDDDRNLTVTLPAKAAGTYDFVVKRSDVTVTKTDALVYA